MTIHWRLILDIAPFILVFSFETRKPVKIWLAMKIEPDLWESLWPWQVATQGEGMIESWFCFYRRDNARKIPKVTALVFFTFISKVGSYGFKFYRQQFWSWQDTFGRKFKSTTILIWAGYARHGYGGQLEGELRHSMTSQAPNMLGMRSSTGVFLVNLFVIGLLLNIWNYIWQIDIGLRYQNTHFKMRPPLLMRVGWLKILTKSLKKSENYRI